MKELIQSINQIIKYALKSNIAELEKEQNLEKNLIIIYKLYFEFEYNFDEVKYSEFDITKFLNIEDNIKSNFPTIGFYNTFIDLTKVPTTESNCALGDAFDDLFDIIKDLLEIKWRLENNSYDDGIWYFKFIFKNHTKQHILGLLHYLNETKSY